MHLTYLVVDQNYLRRKELEGLLRAKPDVRIVLPDLAMFEIAKSKQRGLTLRCSLATLAKYRRRVFVSRAIGECLHYELFNAKAVTGHMVHREATKYLRKVLSAIETGVSNAALERVIEGPEDHLTDLRRDYLDHPSNKSRSRELVNATKREMAKGLAERLRGNRATREEKMAFVRKKAPCLLVNALLELGFPSERALALVRRQSMCLRYFYSSLWLCLDWEEQGRLEGLREDKVTNDLLDRQYVLTATFFDGVLSDDRRMRCAYSAVMELLKTRL